mgnify:CR=1 FL=1
MLEFLKRHLEGTIGVLFLTALILVAIVASNQIAINNAINSVTTITVTTTKTTTGLQPIYNGNRIDVLIERLETRNINLANNLRAYQLIMFILGNAPTVDNKVAWLRSTESLFKRIAEASNDAELKGISLQISEVSSAMLKSIEDNDGQAAPDRYPELDYKLNLLTYAFDDRFKYLLDRDLTEAAQVLEQT